MLKAFIIDTDSLDRVRKLLGQQRIPQRWLDDVTWLLFTNDEDTAWTLPHTVFRDKYVVVSHAEDHMVIERTYMYSA